MSKFCQVIKQIARPLTTSVRNLEVMTAPTIFRDVNSVLKVLNNHKQDNKEAVESLLGSYNIALKMYEEDKSNSSTSHVDVHPLIVLEGLDGCGKSTITRNLASRFHAVRWNTPPQSISKIRHLFEDHPQLSSTYYALGNYIAALECLIQLKMTPVFMDRFWHSTAAYGIAQAVHDFPDTLDLPPEGDNFYHWPSDLLKPTKVFFLNVDEDVRLQRLSRRKEITTQEALLKSSSQFRENIVLTYKNMVDPNVEFIDCNPTVGEVVSTIANQIKHLF